MLKAQLKSKIGALGSSWQDIEDLLTGDFFGALDYLPRRPFMHDFMKWVGNLNPDTIQPSLDAVDWDTVEFKFWHRMSGDGESAEPDVLLVSNRWVVVIEVKLDSGLGEDQPWREYCVGREFARERGLPEDSVFYLLVSRQRLNIRETFSTPDDPKRRELLTKASRLLWHQVVALVERWLEYSAVQQSAQPEQERLLADLLGALRRRRSIAFSGFDLMNQDTVYACRDRFFCPDQFAGFIANLSSIPISIPEESRFLSLFGGYQNSSPKVHSASENIFVDTDFNGFETADLGVIRPDGALMVGAGFAGFMERCAPCAVSAPWSISLA